MCNFTIINSNGIPASTEIRSHLHQKTENCLSVLLNNNFTGKGKAFIKNLHYI